MMSENYCYAKHTVIVRAMAQAGLFGRCYFAEGEYLHDVKNLHRRPDGTPTWRATWQVGKRGCTYGTHSLGPALEFFGPDARVATVSCVGTGVHTDPEHPHDDTCLMLCQLTTGTAGQGHAGTAGQGEASAAGTGQPGGLIKIRVDMMSNRPGLGSFYSLQGTKGCYESARGLGDTHKVWLGDEVPPGPVAAHDRREWRPLADFEDEYLPDYWKRGAAEAAQAGHGGGDYFIARDFVRAILDNRPPPIDVYRAMDYTVPGLISEQSIAQGGAPLPVPDFRQLV
jgi:predicted dehydrogenase